MAGDAGPPPVPGLVGTDLFKYCGVTGCAVAVRNVVVEDGGRGHVSVMAAAAVLGFLPFYVGIVTLFARRLLPMREVTVGAGGIRVQTAAPVDESHLRGVTLPAGVACA